MKKKVIAICTACFLLTGTAAADSSAARQTVPELTVESVTETEPETEAPQEVGDSGEAPESLIDMALNFFGGAADMAMEAADAAAEAADNAGKVIGGAADSFWETVSGAFDKARETFSETTDWIRDTAESVMKQAENAADKVQDTAEEMSEGISEAAQEAKEGYDKFVRKWARVLAYLKGKAVHTNITDEEWERLESGLYRAVNNAYRHGWFGEDASLRSIHTGTDFFFQTVKYCYQYIKEQITISEFVQNMLMLTGRDGSGVLVKVLTGIFPGMEIEQAAQVIEKLLPIVVVIMGDVLEEETQSVSVLPVTP